LTPGSKRYFSIGKFGRSERVGRGDGQANSRPSFSSFASFGGAVERYFGRHADPRGKASRARAARIIPAAGAAAALVAGAAAYSLVASAGHTPATQLSADMSLPAVNLSISAHGGVGVDSVASSMIKAAAGASRAVAPASTAPSASRSPRATQPKASPSAAPARTTAAAKAASTPRASVKAAPAAPAPAAKTLSCNLSDGLLPDNVTAIVTFLIAHGYSDNAAAGIAGNMYQESKGNPESEGMGGGGLIGFTPLPAGYVTGNASADLQTQLSAVLTYNQQWSSYLPELNSAATPADAADIYVTDFERAGIPAASTREASADDVAGACGI
jgi:Phage tail lysozyme